MAGAEKCIDYISDKNVIKDYNEKILEYMKAVSLELTEIIELRHRLGGEKFD